MRTARAFRRPGAGLLLALPAALLLALAAAGPLHAQTAPGTEPAAPTVVDPLEGARRLLKDDKYEEALAEVRRAVAADPNSATGQTLLGDALYRRGDFEEAEEAYRRAVTLDPSFPAGQFGMGRILRTAGRYGDAAGFFHKAAILAPDNAKYVRILANHVARRQDQITMLTHYLEMPAAEDERIIQNVRAWIELLKFLGDEPLGEIVRSEPTDLPMNVLRGQVYLKADVNGLAGQRFAFDTGATGITVSPRLAKKGKLKTIHPFSVTGMGGKGTVAGDLVLIRTLTVGGVTIRNVTATVAEPAGTEEGLIGPSVFGSFRITLDLETGTLGLRRHEPPAEPPATPGTSAQSQASPVAPPASPIAPQAPPAGTVRLPFRNVNGQIIAKATLNGVSLNAMVDTGASSSIAALSSVARVQGLELLPGEWSQGRSSGLGGSIPRKTIRSARLGFAGLEFKADGIPCQDLSRFSRALESEVYIVVGFPELARSILEIDYRAMTLTFTARRP